MKPITQKGTIETLLFVLATLCEAADIDTEETALTIRDASNEAELGSFTVSEILERGRIALALSDPFDRINELEDLLTSARAIAERKGEGTAWERFSERLKNAGIGSITPKTFRVLPSDDGHPNPEGGQ